MYRSGLHETAIKYGTDFWNDSCSIDEINYALNYGAVGATTNPVIVSNVINNEFPKYQPIIQQYIKENPEKDEDEIAWMMIEYTAVEGAKRLLPIFEKSKGQKGRISIQTNTKYYHSPSKMIQQCLSFRELADNIQVKIPVTEAGIEAIEEATYHGISINATVSFSVSQAIEVAKAVSRGLERRELEGHSTKTMHPVCTIMVGRVGDWLKEDCDKRGFKVSQEAIDIAGVAVMKKAYKILNNGAYRTTLLAAAYRNDSQWLEFVGGNIEMTIPHAWIRKFNDGSYSLETRMEKPIDETLLKELKTLPTFNQMYDEEGLSITEFSKFGATQKTLNQFFSGYDTLIGIIRREMMNHE